MRQYFIYGTTGEHFLYFENYSITGLNLLHCSGKLGNLLLNDIPFEIKIQKHLK